MDIWMNGWPLSFTRLYPGVLAGGAGHLGAGVSGQHPSPCPHSPRSSRKSRTWRQKIPLILSSGPGWVRVAPRRLALRREPAGGKRAGSWASAPRPFCLPQPLVGPGPVPVAQALGTIPAPQLLQDLATLEPSVSFPSCFHCPGSPCTLRSPSRQAPSLLTGLGRTWALTGPGGAGAWPGGNQGPGRGCGSTSPAWNKDALSSASEVAGKGHRSFWPGLSHSAES